MSEKCETCGVTLTKDSAIYLGLFHNDAEGPQRVYFCARCGRAEERDMPENKDPFQAEIDDTTALYRAFVKVLDDNNPRLDSAMVALVSLEHVLINQHPPEDREMWRKYLGDMLYRPEIAMWARQLGGMKDGG